MKKTIVISDMHAPFHDRKLFKKVLKYARDIEPTGIVILGDFLDMKPFASHQRGSLKVQRQHTYGAEIKAGSHILDCFDKIESIEDKDYLYGNHEDRLFRWLNTGDNGIVDGHVEAPEDAMGMPDRGYKVHTDCKEDFVELGPLKIIHGLYAAKLNNAKKHHIDFGDVMFGHTHRWEVYNYGDKSAFNIGFLGDIHGEGFRYASKIARNNWCNGFATVYHNENNYLVDSHQVRNGKFQGGCKVY